MESEDLKCKGSSVLAIQKMEKNEKRILELISIIDRIAEQPNLLAMNTTKCLKAALKMQKGLVSPWQKTFAPSRSLPYSNKTKEIMAR